jgi:drug/metabolite transporter (DMT)-like permease
MKKLLIISFMLIFTCMHVKGQTTDSLQIKLNLSGTEFINFHKQYSLGNGLMITGGAFAALGIAMSKDGKVSPLVYGGSGVAFVGWIICFSAFSHIRKAGELMIDEKTRIGITSSGLGITREF